MTLSQLRLDSVMAIIKKLASVQVRASQHLYCVYYYIKSKPQQTMTFKYLKRTCKKFVLKDNQQ